MLRTVRQRWGCYQCQALSSSYSYGALPIRRSLPSGTVHRTRLDMHRNQLTFDSPMLTTNGVLDTKNGSPPTISWTVCNLAPITITIIIHMLFLDTHTRQGENKSFPIACVAFPGDKHNQSPGAGISVRDSDLDAQFTITS